MTERALAAKRRANRFGARAEWLAAALLMLKGYRILARRYVVAGGEIDVIAKRGQVIAFVEVKARPEMDIAASAISEQKRRRISRAAKVWLTRNQWAARAILRGDAIFAARGRLPRHVISAFELRID
jgi:putative endonuclease